MADEANITTEVAISGQVEGSVSTLENATPNEEAQPKLVPESDLLAVKDWRDKWKSRAAELEAELQSFKSAQKPSELKAKYQDSTTTEFLDDVEALIDKKAEEKVAPLRLQAQREKENQALETLLDKELAKANVDTDKVDRDLLKSLALLPKYRNTPIKELAEKLWQPEMKGRKSTENDTRASMDYSAVNKVSDIERLSNSEKITLFEKNPEAKTLWYNHLDWIR